MCHFPQPSAMEEAGEEDSHSQSTPSILHFLPISSLRAAASPSPSRPSPPSDMGDELCDMMQAIRVKFLRLVYRLGESAHTGVVAQVLYRLELAEQLRVGQTGGHAGANRSGGFMKANALAMEQEAESGELDFTCTIMLIGKTGVGKSSTVNSLFDEKDRAPTSSFEKATRKVQLFEGVVKGTKLRIIDTPGLSGSMADRKENEKTLRGIRRFVRRYRPDIVLYFDRLDMQGRDLGDLHLLNSITNILGSAIWFNMIVVLTHAASAPPDGADGVPLSYEMAVEHHSHIIQQMIRQAATDTRLLNPVLMVENHSDCNTNRAGERMLPNGQVWRPQLLLLCFASKILTEANALLKLKDNTLGRPADRRGRVPTLPLLLSSILQTRSSLKNSEEDTGDLDEFDEDPDDADNSDGEADYDELPPFRRLSRDELNQLDRRNRSLYFEELALREKLFQKKQWKQELRRRKERRKNISEKTDDEVKGNEHSEEDNNPIPMAFPDNSIPPTFGSDDPSYRYRYLESKGHLVVRPVLGNQGWDHDSGYDGVNVEALLVFRKKYPGSLMGQIIKDKQDSNVRLECSTSLAHEDGKTTIAGLDIQTVGTEPSYTLRTETRFYNSGWNKAVAGLAMSILGGKIAAGMKLEDRVLIGKRLKLLVNAGATSDGGDIAYGGSLEATLKDRDYPISQVCHTAGLSIMNWHGDMSIGANIQSQFVLGRTLTTVHANLNNQGAGQISIKASSSEQLYMAFIGIIPFVNSFLNWLSSQGK